MNTQLVFYVRVEAMIEEHMLEEEDQDIPGNYDIHLPLEALRWSGHEQAKAVLDRFHDSVAIGVLDDFAIAVFAANGKEITEDY